jgi:hypothetical protein
LKKATSTATAGSRIGCTSTTGTATASDYKVVN